MSNILWVIKTTLPASWREFEVTSFAQSLLDSGAACVHHNQVTSTYKWDEVIHSENEWALEIKVSNVKKNSVVEYLQSSHPYDVPQLIFLKCESSEEYLQWVNSQ